MEKPTKEEVEELIEYCIKDSKVCPLPRSWIKVMEIIEYDKQPRNVQKTIKCLVFQGWSWSNTESKRKVFHNQIKFAGLWSYNSEKVFYELKNFLTNLSEEEWHYEK